VQNSAQWKEMPKRSRFAALARVPTLHWVIAFCFVAIMFYVRWMTGLDRGESVGVRLLFAPLYIFMAGVCVFSFSFRRPSRELIKHARNQARKGHPVRMTILKHDQPIGQDEGLVFLVGDELIYDGLLTTFHITRADVDVPLDQFANGALLFAKDSEWKFGNKDGPSAWGFLLKNHPEYRVYFFPLNIEGLVSIYQPLYTWLRRTSGAEHGPVLPPMQPQPGFKPHRKSRSQESLPR
jgi:hypothetical protein